jgi:hypothetical protein
MNLSFLHVFSQLDSSVLLVLSTLSLSGYTTFYFAAHLLMVASKFGKL